MSAALGLWMALASDSVGPAAQELDLAAPSALPQKIVGGDPTRNGEFDTVVAVLVGTRVCTGTVVTENLVLTAAHCFTDEPRIDDVRVAYGNTISGNRLVGAKSYGVDPRYNGDSDGQDIFDFAFVVVDGHFQFPGGFLLPLSSQDEWDESMLVGAEVMLVGFGEDPNDDSSPIGTKRKVVTTITRFTDSGLEFFAGGSGRDSCSGDSGGPAFVKLDDGTIRLAGILSRGSDPCGDGGYYGIPYAALSWIRMETGVNMLPPGCEEGDCLDTRPPDDGGCSVTPERNGWPLPCLMLLGAWRRRRAR